MRKTTRLLSLSFSSNSNQTDSSSLMSFLCSRFCSSLIVRNFLFICGHSGKPVVDHLDGRKDNRPFYCTSIKETLCDARNNPQNVAQNHVIKGQRWSEAAR